MKSDDDDLITWMNKLDAAQKKRLVRDLGLDAPPTGAGSGRSQDIESGLDLMRRQKAQKSRLN